jgi:hypothetical protein
MVLGDIRIAFVDTTESVDLMVHFELEGRKAALVGHVFGNEAAAVEWLLSDAASGSVAARGLGLPAYSKASRQSCSPLRKRR